MKRKTQNLDVTFVHPYILECIDSEAYDVVTTTNEEKLKFLHKTFIFEYWYKENQVYYHNNIITAFASWCQGLPSSFNIEFENYKIIELAKKWGSLPADATERQEDKILSNYWNFIAVKTFQLFKKYNII